MKKQIIIMKPKLFVVAAGISLLIAYPVSQTLSIRDKTIQSQQRTNHSLQLRTDNLQKPRQNKTGKLSTLSQPTRKVAVSIPKIKPTVHISLASDSCQSYASLFDQYNWSPSVAMAICQAESQGNPNAVSNGNINPDGVPDFGLMQLHGIDILDPAANVRYAYYNKYLTQGWGAWSTYQSGTYEKYL